MFSLINMVYMKGQLKLQFVKLSSLLRNYIVFYPSVSELNVLMFVPRVCTVPAQLHFPTVTPCLQPCLGNLQWVALVHDSFPHQLNALLHIKNLLLDLLQCLATFFCSTTTIYYKLNFFHLKCDNNSSMLRILESAYQKITKIILH